MTTQPLDAFSVDAYIGEQVHALAWKARVSQRELARTLGVTPGTISRKIRGERPWTVSELVDTANALGVTVADLTEGVERARRDSNPKPSDLVFAEVVSLAAYRAERVAS